MKIIFDVETEFQVVLTEHEVNILLTAIACVNGQSEGYIEEGKQEGWRDSKEEELVISRDLVYKKLLKVLHSKTQVGYSM